MTFLPQPHEIRRADGSAAYYCRSCLAEDSLQWFMGTSCPVCDKPECHKELGAEYQAAYDALGEETHD